MPRAKDFNPICVVPFSYSQEKDIYHVVILMTRKREGVIQIYRNIVPMIYRDMELCVKVCMQTAKRLQIPFVKRYELSEDGRTLKVTPPKGRSYVICRTLRKGGKVG